MRERFASKGNAQLLLDGRLYSSSSSKTNNLALDENGIPLDDCFDEPWEWAAKLNALVAQTVPTANPAGNRQTPLMTPKKATKFRNSLPDNSSGGIEDIQPDSSSGTANSEEVLSSDEGEVEEESGYTVLRKDGCRQVVSKSGSRSPGQRVPHSFSTEVAVDASVQLNGASESSSSGSFASSPTLPVVDMEPYDSQSTEVVLPGVEDAKVTDTNNAGKEACCTSSVSLPAQSDAAVPHADSFSPVKSEGRPKGSRKSGKDKRKHNSPLERSPDGVEGFSGTVPSSTGVAHKKCSNSRHCRHQNNQIPGDFHKSCKQCLAKSGTVIFLYNYILNSTTTDRINEINAQFYYFHFAQSTSNH